MKEIPYFCIHKEKRYLRLYLFDKTGLEYVHKKRTDRQKKDNLWKSILEDIFDDFLRFMRPDADKVFDFERGITFLDKELEQLFPPEKNKVSPKIVDKLAKLYTRDGTEEWVLIHCEVQGEYRKNLPQRMFTYYSRIFDKYGKRILACAILTGPVLKTRPNSYVSEFLGTKLAYSYNVYQISRQSEDELLKSKNPFAMVALAVRSVLKNKPLDDEALMKIKLKLARKFLKMALPKEKIYAIMFFMKRYIHFENSNNDIIFDKKLEQIKGRKETMGLVEMAMAEREELGLMRGKIEGKNEVIINMIQNDFTDDVIAKAAAVTPNYVQKIRTSLN